MIGSQISHFNILSKLGEGGMGEVYRASDVRLGREVAIKILPTALTADPERLARLQREARILASLSHPNIAALHDIGDSNGVHYLVMELAEGETLEARLKRGRLSQDEALKIGVQIGRALEAAHAQEIVHRDLKPANVMIDDSGAVKLLDFGLAKGMTADDGGASGLSLANSPTLTAQATSAGMILGTAAYMSPEQARGQALDKRTDIWSFGLMLIEMLSGERVFQGDTVSDLLAAVLRADIDLSGLPDDAPFELQNVLRRATVRSADRRLHDVADVRIVLEEILEGEIRPLELANPETSKGFPLGWVAAAFAVGGLLALGASQFLGGAATSGSSSEVAMKFEQLTLAPGDEQLGSIAPDGESFLFVSDGDIFFQRIGGQTAINITESCDLPDGGPAFSPDGSRVAFRSECDGMGIFLMGAMGESRRKVTGAGYDPTWSPDGTKIAISYEPIVDSPWSRSNRGGMDVVDVATGEVTKLTDHDGVQPAWSPDGRWVVFWGLPPDRSQRDIFVVRADGSTPGVDEAINITDDFYLDWSPIWAPDGKSIYFSSSRGGTFNIWRIDFDTQTGQPVGEPHPLTVPTSWSARMSLSADGKRLLYVDRNVRGETLFAAIDAQGRIAGEPTEIALGSLETGGAFSISPDGSTLAFATGGHPQHLIAIDSDGSNLRQLTEGDHRDRQTGWSPDGQWIAFQTDRYPGESYIGLIRADGSGLRPSGATPFPSWYPVWSPDGQTLAVSTDEGSYTYRPWADDVGATLEELPQPGEGLNFWPDRFSSDGESLLGVVMRGAVPASIQLFHFETQSYEMVQEGNVFGRSFFLAGDEKIGWVGRGGVIAHDRATGRQELIYRSNASNLNAASSANGRHIAIQDLAQESDIWMATLEPQSD